MLKVNLKRKSVDDMTPAEYLKVVNQQKMLTIFVGFLTVALATAFTLGYNVQPEGPFVFTMLAAANVYIYTLMKKIYELKSKLSGDTSGAPRISRSDRQSGMGTTIES